MKLASATPEQLEAIEAALAPFLKWVEVNDHDTLSMIRIDSEVLTVATGSWSQPAPVTVGDFRALSDACEKTEPEPEMVVFEGHSLGIQIDSTGKATSWRDGTFHAS